MPLHGTIGHDLLRASVSSRAWMPEWEKLRGFDNARHEIRVWLRSGSRPSVLDIEVFSGYDRHINSLTG
jgi:hypothetical protein